MIWDTFQNKHYILWSLQINFILPIIIIKAVQLKIIDEINYIIFYSKHNTWRAEDFHHPRVPSARNSSLIQIQVVYILSLTWAS